MSQEKKQEVALFGSAQLLNDFQYLLKFKR